MAWYTIRGRQYYYRSVWMGDRTRLVYAGCGEVGRVNERRDLRERAAKARRWAEEQTHRAELKEARRLILMEIDARLLPVIEAARAALHATGYHQGIGGEWRMRREVAMAIRRARGLGGVVPEILAVPAEAEQPVPFASILDSQVILKMVDRLCRDPERGEFREKLAEMLLDDAARLATEVAGEGASPLVRSMAETYALTLMSSRLAERAALACRPQDRPHYEGLCRSISARLSRAGGTLAVTQRLFARIEKLIGGVGLPPAAEVPKALPRATG